MQCIEKTQSSTQALFESLVGRMRRRLYHRAFQALRNSDDAEDVAQEAVVRAWMHLDSFRTRPHRDAEAVMTFWLQRIAVNQVRNLLRRRKRQPMLPLDGLPGHNGQEDILPELADRSHDPAARMMKSELSEQVQQAIERLSPEYRTCILLRHQQCSYQEIGELLNCPLGTVRSRIHRARASLRLTLQTEGD